MVPTVLDQTLRVCSKLQNRTCLVNITEFRTQVFFCVVTSTCVDFKESSWNSAISCKSEGQTRWWHVNICSILNPLMFSDFQTIAFSISFKNRIWFKSMTFSRQSSVSSTNTIFLIYYVIYRFININWYRSIYLLIKFFNKFLCLYIIFLNF